MPALLSAKELHLQFGLQKVLEDATLAIEEGEKVGLVGRNGTGKSSLLKILADTERPDRGTVSRKTGLITGYLSQEFTLREDATVLQNVRDGAAHVLRLIQRYESGAAKGTEEVTLLNHINALDGWNLESRIKTVLTELAAPAPEQIVANLSGGEKRRVALCRALVSNPDLLILDEPTNHLDAVSIAWLEEYLQAFRGGCLFVTHDRYFLDRIAVRILELENGRIFSHPGSYRSYLEAKAERQAAEAAREERRQKFLRSELEFVRAGVKAQRRKSRYRLEQYYEIAAQSGPEEELDVQLLIPPPPPMANIVLETKNLGHAIDGKQLFSGLDLAFEPGTCTGVVGRNGVGKTTLLRLLMGEISPTEGRVTIGKRTVFNYVDQQRLALDGEKSVLEEIGGKSDFVNFGENKLHVRTYLKRFLFSDERVLMRVDRLSGGERSRLLLAKILIRGGNFLILDEPTNDLDLPTLRILEEALLDFPGCTLVVSHDRYFLDRVCDQLLVFEGNGTLHLCAGNYSYYAEKRREAVLAQRAQAAARNETPKTDRKAEKDKARPRKLTWKEERELESIEPAIAALEAEISALDAKLHSPEFYAKNSANIASFLADLEQKRAQLEALFQRWEELESIKSG